MAGSSPHKVDGGAEGLGKTLIFEDLLLSVKWVGAGVRF